MAAKELMQHEARQNYTYYDEFQRPWFAIVDTRCQPHLSPCAPLIPEGWSAPVMPPEDCLRAHPTVLGRLVILWDKWIESAVAAENAFAQTLQQEAGRLFGDDASKRIAANDPRLMDAVGTRPMSSLLVRAARAGNLWATGRSQVRPEWVTDELLQTLPQFRAKVEAALFEGLDFPDAPEDEALRAAGALTSEPAPLPKSGKRVTKDAATVEEAFSGII